MVSGVRNWLGSLDGDAANHVAFYIDLLAEREPLLGESYTRQLDGKLRELRSWLDGGQTRISYWVASGRRIILLTVWHKAEMRETAEDGRARRAVRRRQGEQHVVDEEES